MKMDPTLPKSDLFVLVTGVFKEIQWFCFAKSNSLWEKIVNLLNFYFLHVMIPWELHFTKLVAKSMNGRCHHTGTPHKHDHENTVIANNPILHK